MATVKKRKKGKLILPVSIVLVLAIVITSAVVINKKSSGESVTLNTVSTGNIVESVNATGDIAAGTSRDYTVSSVATVKEVFVKVGDSVKEGDVMATFDTSDLDAQVEQMQLTYDTAKVAYDDSVKSEKEAAAKLKDVNERIPAMEKKLARLQKQTDTTTTVTEEPEYSLSTLTQPRMSDSPASSTKNNTTTVKREITTVVPVRNASGEDTSIDPSEISSLLDLSASTHDTSSVQSSLDGIADSLTDMIGTLSKLTNDVETLNALLTTISNTIAEQLASGNYSPDAIAQACGDAIAIAIQKGLVDETMLLVESGIAVDMVENAVRAIDWASIVREMESTDTTQLTATELQLAALYAEREVFSASADPSVSNAQRAVMNTSKQALDTLKESQKSLNAGWTAAFSGVVTQCNIAAGEQTNLATTGIRIENMDAMVVNISLGEYDVHKVKVGMAATITTAYGKYTGEVATIAPTATGSSNSSIVDSVGSMAGISGLSSLTESGAGVKCTVTVDDPDSNIIVGFDADVEIVTGEYDDVTCVPIESIVLEKDGSYVYLYNEAEGIVTKTPITTSATSNTSYQVTSGLKVGDKIVATPSTDYKEDSFKVKVVDKTVPNAATGK